MPVFFKGRKRVLFIHVPKAGGTSIEAFFEANGFSSFYLDRGESVESLNSVRTCSPQHMHAELLRKTFKLEKFDYVFMTVRHPIRRLLSKFAMEFPRACTVPMLEDWAFREFPNVFLNPTYMDNHLRPQCDFLVPEADIFKLEDGFGENLVARLEERTGLDFPVRTVPREMSAIVDLPDFNTTHPGLRRMVHTYYARDFERFEYF